jgi:hypothetical protein
MSLTETERDLVTRLRRLSANRRRQLFEEAEAEAAADAARRSERLEHLHRAVSLWPRSEQETRQLIAEIDAAREIEE